jgi:hypothetical protein
MGREADFSAAQLTKACAASVEMTVFKLGKKKQSLAGKQQQWERLASGLWRLP